MHSTFLVVWMAAVSASAGASKPAATAQRANAGSDALLAKVQKTYANRAFAADFCQTYVDAMTGARPTECGSLQVAADGRVRFAYAAPQDKLFVFDGNDAFFVEPQAAQITQVRRFGEGAAGHALALLWGRTHQSTRFAHRACDRECPPLEAGQSAVTFIPKEPMAAARRLDVVIDVPRGEVVQVVLTDALDNQTRYVLTRRKFDQKLAADAFTYVPPKDFSLVQAQAQ